MFKRKGLPKKRRSAALAKVVSQSDEANGLLAQIIQSSDVAILSKDLDGTILSWNVSAEELFGYKSREIVGKNILILIPIERHHEEAEIIAQLKAGKAIRQTETVRLHKSGREIAVSISVSPVRDANGRVFGASKFIHDIRDKKRTEARLLKLTSELEHVDRMTSMGQISAGIAHELNQPLTAIANYANAAKLTLQSGEHDFAERAVDLMDKAAAQSMRAAGVVRHLRDFVEKRDDDRRSGSLNTAVQDALELALIGAAADGVRVDVLLDIREPLVVMNRIQIQQVVLNLCRNSIEAMRPTRNKHLHIETKIVSEIANVIVEDTGPGLPPEVRSRLFQPFVTTKPDGMGIGLSICQSIVQAHGGRIWAMPAKPSGAGFGFSLPLIQ